MKGIFFRPSLLQILYLVIYVILFGFIIYTPTLIEGPVHITKKIILAEETIEGTLLAISFIVSILILNLYKREVNIHKEMAENIYNAKKKVEDRLNDSDRYIGVLNVQLHEIKTIFSNVNKYPESKDDLKRIFQFFGERILGIVNSNWVLIRIINGSTHRTISEHFATRQGSSNVFPHVSNKYIIEDKIVLPLISVISNSQNLNIVVCCILPVEKISNDQRVFIQAIINEVSKMFIIFNSSYYKKENKLFNEDTHEMSSKGIKR
jgi:hypothetical protein